MMIIDPHIHEKTYSSDSTLSLTEIISRARSIGLDGVCITDHDSNEITDTANQLSKETGFLIIVGVEILTYEGDLTVFGLNKIPSEMMHAQEVIEMAIRAGGIAISAHPFRQNNRGMGSFVKEVYGLAGLEAFNGSTTPYNNLYAYGLAKELNITALGASDAHNIKAIGKYATAFQGTVRDIVDFIEAVKSGKALPAVLTDSGYETIDLSEILHNDNNLQ